MNPKVFRRIAALLLALVLLNLCTLTALAAEGITSTPALSKPDTSGNETEPDSSVIRGDSEDAAIGIIGGADGPTVIFVSSNWWILPLGLAAAGAILVTAVILIKKQKKQ